MKRDAFFDRWTDVTLRREQMHSYQETGRAFLKANPFSGLFIDMGLGKTVTTATVIVDLINDFEFGDGEKVLIIGPKRVATQTWPNEFRTWNHLAGYNLSVIHVDDDDPRLKAAAARARQDARDRREFPKEREQAARQAESTMRNTLREQAARSRATIHIVSRDWVEWLVNFYGPKWPYRMVVIDESSGFKDHKSGRFEALKSVRDQPTNPIRRLHILTATPAAETYEHLFAQIYLLDKGARFGRFITKFRENYFIAPHAKDPSRTWKLRPGADKEILAKITDICLVMKEEDYLPRVPPVFVQREVTMTDGQYALYLKMEKDMIVTLDDGSVVKAETAAAVSQKLLQMASGVLYDTQLKPGQTEEDDHVKITKVHRIHEHKMDMLREIVEESMGKPILVAYHHRSSRDRLQKAFAKAVLMDKDGKCIKAWNAGKIPMLLMHPASGGHGLNLQAGGHIIVFFDIPWSLELYLQLIGRLSRQGQKHRVTVFLLICKGTLDHTVVTALQAKEDAQNILFKILKRMRAKLRKIMKRAKMDAAIMTPKEHEMMTDVLAVTDHEEDDEL